MSEVGMSDAQIIETFHKIMLEIGQLKEAQDNILCHTLDIAIDFYLLRQELNKFGGNWTQVIFHPDCDSEQRARTLARLKRIPPLELPKILKQLPKELKEVREEMDGLMSHYGTNAIPLFEKMEEHIDASKKKKEEKYTIG